MSTSPVSPTDFPAGFVTLVVNGGLMRGMRAEGRMIAAGAVFLREVTTAPLYRLWSIADRFPGMIHSATGGAAITAEMYAIPHAGFIAVLEEEPDGLCIGRVQLADGTSVLGVMAEPRLVESRIEITAFGGWRAYVEAKAIAQTAAAAPI